MAHTPGPWEVSDKPGVWVGPVIKANHGTRGVAFVCGESDANAHLIAAAPELLRAAKIAAAMMGGDDDGPDDDELHDVWLVVRSAIAKAEGKGSE